MLGNGFVWYFLFRGRLVPIPGSYPPRGQSAPRLGVLGMGLGGGCPQKNWPVDISEIALIISLYVRQY